MNNVVYISRSQRLLALNEWINKCRNDFNFEIRYPDVDFFSDNWNLHERYKAYVGDLNLEPAMKSLELLAVSYSLIFRCTMAEIAIADKKKGRSELTTLKRLFLTFNGPDCLLDLEWSHLRDYEQRSIRSVIADPSSVVRYTKDIAALEKLVVRLRELGIIHCAAWRMSQENRSVLRRVTREYRARGHLVKGTILDRKIEALSDASNAMFSSDLRLNNFDRSCIAIANIQMCAPSRVNEVLSMEADDFFQVSDYTSRRSNLKRSQDLERVHLLLLQKGSKGAKYAAKPVLNFMIDLANESRKVILEGGKRSRMLVEWYEANPNKIFLPPELECVRGTPIDRMTLWKIMQLTIDEPADFYVSRGMVGRFFKYAKKNKIKVFEIENPRPLRVDGTLTSHKYVQAVSWEDAERYLLARVKEALEEIRNVTRDNPYRGRLSKMLVLVDIDETPYLPSSIKYATLSKRFKNYETGSRAKSIFEKLNLTMVVDGEVQYAEMNTHDPRHWLTTEALRAKEGLSDVLINKWANRHSLKQINHYDHRSDTEKADHAAMPVIELRDVSLGLEKMDALSTQYGLKTCHLTVEDAAISMASMAMISEAINDRPIAKSSNQLVIAYPTRYGVCFHDHHVVPCRAYACIPCDKNHVIKGHLPTNEALEKSYREIYQSIISQLDRLVTAHNRGVADFPEGLESHMLALIEGGLSSEAMTDRLIDDFHELKDRIKSTALRTKLEEAFAAKGFLSRIESADVSAGALIRYHNPSRHGSPGHERALDKLGGRKRIAASLKRFEMDHPQFAHTTVGLRERDASLVANNDDEVADDN